MWIMKKYHPFFKDLGLTKDDVINKLKSIRAIETVDVDGEDMYKILKDGFIEKIKELYDELIGVQEESTIQFGDDIELTEGDSAEYVEFIGELPGEPVFRIGGKPFKYVWARYPDGRKDIGAYAPTEDRVYDIDFFRTNMLKKKPNGMNLEGSKQLETESDYPLGANDDPYAPYNEKGLDRQRSVDSNTFELKVMADEYAIFEKAGQHYVYDIESVTSDAYGPYAEREETPLGRDEDGMMDVEYGEFDIDEQTVSNFLNDNLGELSMGSGLDDFENGANFVLIDNELLEELKDLGSYISHPRDKQNWFNFLTSIGVNEVTSAASSGAFVGPMSSGPIHKGISPSDAMKDIDEQGIGSVGAYEHPGFASSEFMGNKGKKGKARVNKGVTHDNTMYPKGKFVKVSESQKESLKKYINESIESNKLSNDIMNAIDMVGYDVSYEEFAIAVADILRDSYGSHNYKPFINILNTSLNSVNENAFKKTQYPNGGFVKLDDCTKLNNNKEAQNGGCSVGAVDNVVKTKGSKESVVSDDALYYEVANRTGKTIAEVKSIIKSNKDRF